MQPLILEPNRPQTAYWRDLYRHRELFFFFAWRDILVRYKQAALGIAWALFRPIISMMIFTFIFSYLANFPSEGVGYPLFVLSGMVPWLFVSSVLMETTTCLLNNPALLTRVYFPRLIIPASSVIVQSVDFLISLGLLFFLIPFMGSLSYSTLPYALYYLFLLTLFTVGCGMFLSAITLKWRDVRYLVPFFSQIGMYLSPVAYSSALIPENWQWVYFLNPVAGIIEGLRFSIFGVTPTFLFEATVIATLTSLATFVIGLRVFQKFEPNFGDMI